MLEAVSKSFSVLFMGTNFLRLLGGLWVTVWISLVSVFFSLILGFLFGILMTKKSRAVRIASKIYLEAMRILPQMVLLFIFFYGVSRAFSLNLSGEAASVIVFTLWGTAEMGDLVRGSIEAGPSVRLWPCSRAYGKADFPLCDNSADFQAADSALDESHHKNDKDDFSCCLCERG